jgi:hypothetical protein
MGQNENHNPVGITDYRMEEPEVASDAFYGNCEKCACTGFIAHPDLGRFPRDSDLCYRGHGSLRCGHRFDEHER